MKFPLHMQILLAMTVGMAPSIYAEVLPAPATEGADPIVAVRGRDSIVESIDMSPQATSFWRNLRETVNNIDLNDHEKVSNQLTLEGNRRRPLQGPMQFSYPSWLPLREPVQARTYRVQRGGSITRWSFLPDLRFVCLSRREIERNFGAGKSDSRIPAQVVEEGYGGPLETVTSRLGYFHSMRYKVNGGDRYIEASFSPGGCAVFIGLMQPNSDEFGLPEPSTSVSIE
ncbi:hypothetical protein ACKI2N_032765 [Cupriavidus sp. 30B13]|uniref:hypothetical protein n=1 Tax=Cupriavidus sp. 30B13 TaxID=3384241 RepID=UPI003B9092FB